MQKHILMPEACRFDPAAVAGQAADRLSGSVSVDDAWQEISRAAAELGFDYLIYLLASPSKGPDGFVARSNLPDWWTDYYLDTGQAGSDPFFKTCHSFNPICVGSEFLEQNSSMLSPKERKFISEAAETGLRSGFSSPVALVGSEQFGGWNFGTSQTRSGFGQHFQTYGPAMRLLGFMAHERIQALSGSRIQIPDGRGDEAGSVPLALTSRERDCLLWLARGLRTRQIAEKLSITEATVEFHFKSARRRLHATTREQALARAISENLICP